MQETLSYGISWGVHLLGWMHKKQIKVIRETIRAPNENEMKRGVPQWFRVQEVARTFGRRVDKYYFSIDGTKFRSITELKRWRENLQFEEYDTDALSF